LNSKWVRPPSVPFGYLVAMDKIISIKKQQIHVKEKVIPIGSIYLPAFMKKISKMGNH
jgi:hypothetical protein